MTAQPGCLWVHDAIVHTPTDASTTSPSSDPQARTGTVHNQWNDLLEMRARRCTGCGEWSYTDLCDWCLEVAR